MRAGRLLSLVVVALAAAGAAAGDAPAIDRLVVQVTVASRADVNRVAAIGEPWEVHLDRGFVVLDVGFEGYDELVATGLPLAVDWDRTDRLNRPLVPLEGQTEGIPGYPCYRTVEETLATGAALAATYPDLATWTDIGDSWEKLTPGGLDGYDMMVLKLTNSAVGGDKPDLWVEGGIHARELTTAETATRFAEYLLANYGVDADVTWLLDYHEIHILLQTNPDGRKRAETGLSWRKNTDSDDGCGSSSSWGTDVNRNFDFYWACCGGSSSDPCSETYHGPAGGSEPETQAVQDYVTANFPDFRPDDLTTPAPDDTTGIFLDLHSYGGDVLSVFGFQSTPTPPNGGGILRLGRKLSYFNGYYARLGSLYPVDGSTKDWAYGRLGIPAYTIEMGTDFFESCATFENTVYPANLPMLVYAAKAAAAPYLEAIGPDVVGPTAVPSLVAPGDPVTLGGAADDTRYGSGDGTTSTLPIVSAEYYVDVPPWQPGAVAIPLAAADGSFDSTVEALAATLDTTALADGRHILFFRARDTGGSWGVPSAVFLRVQDPTTTPHLAGSVLEDGTSAPLAATVTAGIYQTTTDPADGSYDMLVIAGTYDVSAEAAEHVAVTQPGVVAASGTTTTVDFDLPAWPRLEGTVTEAGSGLPLTATVSAGAYSTATDPADGSYAMSVAPGTYDVRATATDHGAASQSGVQAVAGGTSVLDFQLQPLTTLLDDDVEGGNIGWTVQSTVPGGTNWSIVTDGASNHAWFSSDHTSIKDDRLQIGPFPLDNGASLSFSHHWAFEGSTTPYDGGALEVSTDGATWVDVVAAGGVFVSGGYTGTLSSSFSNPLGGRQAWTADSPGVVHSEVDLGALAQHSLWFRFRLGCDSSSGDLGWWVDDILLQTTVADPTIFEDGFDGGDTAAWSAVVGG